jgi:hypothetical protein
MEDTEQGLLFAAQDFTVAATSHPPPEFLAAHPPEPEVNETAVSADAETGGGMPKLPKLPPLTWVEVPVAEVTDFLEGYFMGRLAPLKALKSFQLARGPKDDFVWGGDSAPPAA